MQQPDTPVMAEQPPKTHPFGAIVAEAAHSVLAEARHALADDKLSDAEAVHALRKAFKRWRALLRLLRRPIGEPAEGLRGEGRELMRVLSGARDAQASLDALDDLANGAVAISPTSLASMRTKLLAQRDAAESAAFTPEMRERIGRYLDFAEMSVERWALPAVGFDPIADALTLTYRRARQLVPEKWQEVDPEHLHELRRRVVEHRHQIELIEPLWPRLTKVWADEAQRLRNRLGACQDLAVLSDMLAPHRPLAPWRSRLTPALVARRAEHLRSAARLAGRLFAEKPKAFRTRIAALWTAREKRKTASA